MKTFRDLVIIKQPLDRVWATMRDRLPDLATQLDDIDSIVCLSREQPDARCHRLVNQWRSAQKIPSLLQNRLGATEISWIDRNEWIDESHTCTWAIEPSIFPEHIRCAGRTTYEPALGGRGTRITFSGEFELAPGALSTLAGPLEQPVSAFAESIVTVFIPKNLRKVMEAASTLIGADG
ncbi:MAG: hypothetical protein ACFCUJ_08750 [Thiotrichales bacterium]